MLKETTCYDSCSCGARKRKVSAVCWNCYSEDPRSYRTNHHLEVQRLTPQQRILFDYLCRRPVSKDTRLLDIERDAFFVAVNSRNPIEDLKLFGPPEPRPVSMGSGLNNFRSHRGRRNGVALL